VGLPADVNCQRTGCPGPGATGSTARQAYFGRRDLQAASRRGGNSLFSSSATQRAAVSILLYMPASRLFLGHARRFGRLRSGGLPRCSFATQAGQAAAGNPPVWFDGRAARAEHGMRPSSRGRPKQTMSKPTPTAAPLDRTLLAFLDPLVFTRKTVLSLVVSSILARPQWLQLPVPQHKVHYTRLKGI
jgi:hypothetical protein